MPLFGNSARFKLSKRVGYQVSHSQRIHTIAITVTFFVVTPPNTRVFPHTAVLDNDRIRFQEDVSILRMLANRLMGGPCSRH